MVFCGFLGAHTERGVLAKRPGDCMRMAQERLQHHLRMMPKCKRVHSKVRGAGVVQEAPRIVPAMSLELEGITLSG